MPARVSFYLRLVLALCAAGGANGQEIKPNPLRDVYFGNLHVHSGWSFDGYTNGSVKTPDDAYRWAKGEAISGSEGLPDLQIKRPLDWYAVSEHAEYLGVLPLMAEEGSPLSKCLCPLKLGHHVSDEPLATIVEGRLFDEGTSAHIALVRTPGLAHWAPIGTTDAG